MDSGSNQVPVGAVNIFEAWLPKRKPFEVPFVYAYLEDMTSEDLIDRDLELQRRLLLRSGQSRFKQVRHLNKGNNAERRVIAGILESRN